jgi:hypothetical protein
MHHIHTMIQPINDLLRAVSWAEVFAADGGGGALEEYCAMRAGSSTAFDAYPDVFARLRTKLVAGLKQSVQQYAIAHGHAEVALLLAMPLSALRRKRLQQLTVGWQLQHSASLTSAENAKTQMVWFGLSDPCFDVFIL